MNAFGRHWHLSLAIAAMLPLMVGCKGNPPGKGSGSSTVVEASASDTGLLGDFESLDFGLLYSGDCTETLNDCGEHLSVVNSTHSLSIGPGDPAKSAQSFELAAEEMKNIQRLVAAPDFQERLAHPEPCGKQLQGQFFASFALKYPGDTLARWLKFQEDCVFADRTDVPEDNSVYQVYLALRRIKESRVACPEWQDPGLLSNFDLSNDPLPMSFSCYYCEGRCLLAGVDPVPPMQSLAVGSTFDPNAASSSQ